MNKRLLIGILLLGMSSLLNAGEWIVLSDSVCTSKNGKLKKGICIAKWEDAKAICSASGGRLATIKELEAVITECGGSLVEQGPNIHNPEYMSCYKEHGFYGKHYWTSSEYKGISPFDTENTAWYVRFRNGERGFGKMARPASVRCLSIGK